MTFYPKISVEKPVLYMEHETNTAEVQPMFIKCRPLYNIGFQCIVYTHDELKCKGLQIVRYTLLRGSLVVAVRRSTFRMTVAGIQCVKRS